MLALLHLVPAPRLPAAGRGSTLASWSAWTAWLTRVGPAAAFMGLVRLAAVGLAGYLLVVVTLELLGRATGRAWLQVVAHRVSTPLTRRLVSQVAGLGVAATITLLTVAPTTPAPADAVTMHVASDPRSAPKAPPPTSTTTTGPPRTLDAPVPVMRAVEPSAEAPVMRAFDPDPPAPVMRAPDTDAPNVATTPETGPPSADAGPSGDPTADAPVMRALDPWPAPSSSIPPVDAPAPATPGTSTEGRSLRPAPTDPTSVASDGADHAGPTAPDRWVIRRGDHLWGVARRALAGAWQRPPTDAEVAHYLDELVAANADVLVVPGDADLVFAGQEFALPPVPAT